MHPNQVDILNEEFSPAAADVAAASRPVASSSERVSGMCSIVGVATDSASGASTPADPRGTIRPVDGCVFCQIVAGEVARQCSRGPAEAVQITKRLLNEMIGEGAVLTNEEFPVLFAYLATNFKADE